MHDVIEVIGKGSVIQHGKLSDRVYLLKLDERDVDDILRMIEELANTFNYSKLFCKVPENILPLFIADGYVLEAFIPKFYNSNQNVVFASKFLTSERRECTEKNHLLTFSKLIQNIPQSKKSMTQVYSIVMLNKEDIEQITAIYRKVFETYPFPIFDPEYIIKTMSDNVLYFGAVKDGELIALASSEMDVKGKNAEMTDFATLPNHTGNGIAKMLLMAMENEMKNREITTLYTIARLQSIPMNLTFLRLNYNYSGTLINNTNIAGKIESMNVLYKHI